jgi:hypothetical protein
VGPERRRPPLSGRRTRARRARAARRLAPGGPGAGGRARAHHRDLPVPRGRPRHRPDAVAERTRHRTRRRRPRHAAHRRAGRGHSDPRRRPARPRARRVLAGRATLPLAVHAYERAMPDQAVPAIRTSLAPLAWQRRLATRRGRRVARLALPALAAAHRLRHPRRAA